MSTSCQIMHYPLGKRHVLALRPVSDRAINISYTKYPNGTRQKDRMMKEKSIVLYEHEIKAILDGSLTQLRRPIAPQPMLCGVSATNVAASYGSDVDVDWWTWKNNTYGEDAGCEDLETACPYGVPGDSLWVRETWYNDAVFGKSSLYYRADGEFADQLPRYDPINDPAMAAEIKWRPSIHMPRWASRITLEVTNVRVERVQEISEEDIRAEGVQSNSSDMPGFVTLWDSVYGKRGLGWDANPWVFVVEFRRIRP